jgi:hypothetical protein
MASMLMLLRILKEHFQFTRQPNLVNKLICDNTGLLIQIEEALAWNYTIPNVMLRAEWDLESVILQEYWETGIQFVFMHVKSHQDDSTAITNLSLETRLNVEADQQLAMT